MSEDASDRAQTPDLTAIAADRIVEAALTVTAGAADRRSATLVSRGTDSLWDEARLRLEAAGFKVVHQVLPDGDQQWNPPMDATGVLIHHDPFHPASSANGGSDTIRTLLAQGARLVFVDFPHGLRDEHLRHAIRNVYVSALSMSPEAMQKQAERLMSALDRARAVEIVDTDADAAVLRAEVPWQVRSDWTSARRDHPILQLPFGEVWIACAPTQIADELLADGRGPVEIGIGLNARAPWIEQATLAEKALGRVHLGYGDNELLGGQIRAGWHSDRMLPSRMRLWMEGEDGCRVSLDSVLS
jgi:hypothetical protein